MNRSRVPGLFAVPAALAVGFLAIPLIGLLGRTPWGTMGADLATPRVLLA